MSHKREVEICIISDIHLGTYGCRAKELNRYLRSIRPKQLIINGDWFDIWNFIDRIFDLLSKKGRINFEEIFEICESRIHAIVTFLGLLELINLQQMTIIKGEGMNQFWIEENHEVEDSYDGKNQSDEKIVLESDEEIPTIES